MKYTAREIIVSLVVLALLLSSVSSTAFGTLPIYPTASPPLMNGPTNQVFTKTFEGFHSMVYPGPTNVYTDTYGGNFAAYSNAVLSGVFEAYPPSTSLPAANEIGLTPAEGMPISNYFKYVSFNYVNPWVYSTISTSAVVTNDLDLYAESNLHAVTINPVGNYTNVSASLYNISRKTNSSPYYGNLQYYGYNFLHTGDISSSVVTFQDNFPLVDLCTGATNAWIVRSKRTTVVNITNEWKTLKVHFKNSLVDVTDSFEALYTNIGDTNNVDFLVFTEIATNSSNFTVVTSVTNITSESKKNIPQRLHNGVVNVVEFPLIKIAENTNDYMVYTLPEYTGTDTNLTSLKFSRIRKYVDLLIEVEHGDETDSLSTNIFYSISPQTRQSNSLPHNWLYEAP